MDKRYHIYLLTKGRLGRQKTLSYLSPAVLQHVTVVCPKDELREHKRQPYAKHVDFLPTPNDTLLPNKRYGVYAHHQKQGGRWAMVIEDDLLFYGRQKDGSFVGATKDRTAADRWFLKTAPRLFAAGNSLVGAGPYFMHKNVMARWGAQRINHKCTNVAGYDVDVLLNVIDRGATRDLWGIDTVHNLAVLCNGHTSVVDYGLLWNTTFDPADKSGAGRERKVKQVWDSFLRQMVMFPGLIRRGKQAQHVASFLRVDFMSAPSLFLDAPRYELFKAKGRKLLTAELAFQGRDKQYLRDLLNDYQ
ncbi:hypothetical protein [Ralstonia phage phiRSL1]|uniref:Glycosyltransferase n=1 Tax=Ralstonia phage phiRSL1 TaxID=1980924 RepID=B2ZYD6_9CAUD|nr:beta-glucosyl-HMC-alpha-glucosyltransferase [Ralstonia phage phiRSL1]BAG41682.1 hypothetical protein [Ralstonia phage phiRSL1]